MSDPFFPAASIVSEPVEIHFDGQVLEIASLDAALAFAEAHPHPKGDYDGLIRRLQSAATPAARVEAANAFRWWAQSNGLLADSHPEVRPAPDAPAKRAGPSD